MHEDSPTPAAAGSANTPEFLTDLGFDQLDLPAPLLDGLNAAGFKRCSPIQAEALPIALTGKDVAGQAQTGTGKTAAFLVTVFSRLLNETIEDRKRPSALIVAPTRELAQQIFNEAELIGKNTDFKSLLVVGGIDYDKQAEALKAGVDIVICTPGRLIDYYKQKVFDTRGIKIVVIDEADRLLDLGFAKDMRYILKQLPPYSKRQSLLFSATLSFNVMELTYEYMNLPEFIAVAAAEKPGEGIAQSLYYVENEKKLPMLLGLLKREDWSRLLIFVNTKSGVDWLSRKLQGNQHAAEGITGDLTQNKRFKLMERFKSAQSNILVATDVASRGIHVDDISHVINFDLPQDPEDYIHRIGRTARAGKTGKAVSLVCERYAYHLEAIEDRLEEKIPVEWFEDEWLVEDECGPVAVFQKERKKRASKRRNRPTPRPRQQRQKPSLPPRDPDYFPGTFFGFKPVAEKKKTADSANETDQTKTAAAAQTTKSPKSRSRRRRPRRTPSGKSGTPKKTDTGTSSQKETTDGPAEKK